MTRLCDSHALIASKNEARYPLASGIPPLAEGELEAEHDVQDLLRDMDGLGIARGVLVQRNRYYGYDNSYICDALAVAPDRLRAMCAVDSRVPDCAIRARELLRKDGVIGLRLMEPAKAAPLDWLAGEYAQQVWRVAADEDAVMQFHVFPWVREAALEAVLPVVRDNPVRRIVIDNLSNIDAAAEGFGIDDHLRCLAEIERVHLRFTTLTLLKAKSGGVDAGELIKAMVDLVGPDRLQWGSDVVPPSMTYQQAVAAGMAAVASLATEHQDMILHRNAEAMAFRTTHFE